MGKFTRTLSKSPRSKGASNLQAGVAGASIGTLVLSLSKNIREKLQGLLTELEMANLELLSTKIRSLNIEINED